MQNVLFVGGPFEGFHPMKENSTPALVLLGEDKELYVLSRMNVGMAFRDIYIHSQTYVTTGCDHEKVMERVMGIIEASVDLSSVVPLKSK